MTGLRFQSRRSEIFISKYLKPPGCCELVRKLRQKIEADPNRPQHLVTESGVGYRLQTRLEDMAAD